MGCCPSGRLFEAAACGVPLLSDRWPGIEDFYQPGEEILLVAGAADTLAALALPDAELRRMAARARERTLELHTADRRAVELEQAIEDALAPAPAGAHAPSPLQGAVPCGA
jgi:spore maturation protein CgeB